MSRPTIKRGQIYQAKKHDFQVEIIGKRGGRWLSRILTDKPNVFAGSHTLAHHTIRQHYILISS